MVVHYDASVGVKGISWIAQVYSFLRRKKKEKHKREDRKRDTPSLAGRTVRGNASGVGRRVSSWNYACTVEWEFYHAVREKLMFNVFFVFVFILRFPLNEFDV